MDQRLLLNTRNGNQNTPFGAAAKKIAQDTRNAKCPFKDSTNDTKAEESADPQPSNIKKQKNEDEDELEPFIFPKNSGCACLGPNRKLDGELLFSNFITAEFLDFMDKNLRIDEDEYTKDEREASLKLTEEEIELAEQSIQSFLESLSEENDDEPAFDVSSPEPLPIEELDFPQLPDLLEVPFSPELIVSSE